LCASEQAILEVLALNKHVIISRSALMDDLYRRADQPDPKIIDIFLCKLRKKLLAACNGENYIHTFRGRGFMLAESLKQAEEPRPNMLFRQRPACALSRRSRPHSAVHNGGKANMTAQELASDMS
jgi:two-component system cell cycle response regulator CtrA